MGRFIIITNTHYDWNYLLVRSSKSCGDESSFETITCHKSVEVKIVLEIKIKLVLYLKLMEIQHKDFYAMYVTTINSTIRSYNPILIQDSLIQTNSRLNHLIRLILICFEWNDLKSNYWIECTVWILKYSTICTAVVVFNRHGLDRTFSTKNRHN